MPFGKLRVGEKIIKHDMVNQPPHYALEGVECIDAMVEVFGKDVVKKYAEVAAFKYVWRMNLKGKLSIQDKKKAIWYLRYSMGDDPRADPKPVEYNTCDKQPTKKKGKK